MVLTPHSKRYDGKTTLSPHWLAVHSCTGSSTLSALQKPGGHRNGVHNMDDLGCRVRSNGWYYSERYMIAVITWRFYRNLLGLSTHSSPYWSISLSLQMWHEHSQLLVVCQRALSLQNLFSHHRPNGRPMKDGLPLGFLQGSLERAHGNIERAVCFWTLS